MSGYESLKDISEEKARSLIDVLFSERAYLYAVLDFEVSFGVYDEGHFLIGRRGQAEAAKLQWEYLRELRIFNQERELLLIPSDSGWTGRIREDVKNGSVVMRSGEYILEERQKLWGTLAQKPKETIPGWSLLTSGRGTSIQIPKQIVGPEAGICVRKYMRIPDVSDRKNEELVYQNDIRMVDFCEWGRMEDGQ